MRAESHNRARRSSEGRSDSRKLESIFNAVWGELDAPSHETTKDEVARRVMMYSDSGLRDAERIRLAVLNSFGRPG
jgi:hypothetical protein